MVAAPGRPARWRSTPPTTPFPISDMDEILPGLMENRERVYYAMGTHPEFDQRVLGWLQALRSQARDRASIRRRK